MIDLHVHTKISDSSLSALEVIRLAKSIDNCYLEKNNRQTDA